MPHRQPILLAIGRVLVAGALFATAACNGEHERAAQVDTTTGRSAVGVAARTPAAAEDPALRAATAALDSLTTRFSLARASLDSEALLLRDANRLDSSYVTAYAAFEHRRAAATELRTARDRARRVRDSLAAHEAHPAVGKH